MHRVLTLAIKQQFERAPQICVTARYMLRRYQEEGVWVPVQCYHEYGVEHELNEAGMVMQEGAVVRRLFCP